MKKEEESTPTEDEFDKVNAYYAKTGEKAMAEGVPIVFANDKEQAVTIVWADSDHRKHWFNPLTGRGVIKSKTFRLMQDKPNFIIFNALLNSNLLKRNKVIKLLGLEEETGEQPTSWNSEKINQCIKELRKTTGLDKDELILNGGNIRLIKTIEKRHPKPS